MSSFGDWIALSDVCDATTAKLIKREVSDGIIAPGYTEEALEILKTKKKGNYNIVKIDPAYVPAVQEKKQVFGITFEQGRNNFAINKALLENVVTENKNLPEEAKRDLIIALITLKYTQSNSVCFAKDGQAIGVGAGQQSRIHCTRLAGNKADIWHLRQHEKVLNLPFLPTVGRPDRDNTIDIYISDDYEDVLAEGTWQTLFSEKPEPLTKEEKKAYLSTIKGVALGSDAFFPFGDNIERAAKSGVSYIAEPGGSIRDDNVIETCNRFGMARLHRHEIVPSLIKKRLERSLRKMKIMVVGGGGREHAIIKKIKENPQVTELYALPGNGGIAKDATCVDIAAKDVEGVVAFAKEKGIDFAVVAPDDPLVLGMVDALNAIGIPCFGPDKKAAILEGSKVFSKNLMKKYGIPTAAYEVFDDMEKALAYLETAPLPTVVKADGLALGKGVIIAETKEQAQDAVRSMMADKVFGASGDHVVIEEFMTGPEVSVLAFTDGKTMVPMVSAMDHKRALDGDKGLNTGGMGTIAPNPFYTEAVAKECMEKIFVPTMEAMNKEGRTFKGCLFFGLMITPAGPKVIEYNCRFGDPETQVVLPLLESDLLTIMQAVAAEKLADVEVKFSDKAACCVIMASAGYPQSYEKGFPITLPEKDQLIFVAGAKKEGGKLLTNGGRVLGVTEIADTLPEAIAKSYEAVKTVKFDNAFYRNDIGKKALAAEV